MRVLLITSRSPVPVWRGNQARTAEWLSALADHELALVCPSFGAQPPPSLLVEWLTYRLGVAPRAAGFVRAAATGRPLQEGLYDTGAGRRTVALSLKTWRPDIAIVQMVSAMAGVNAIFQVIEWPLQFLIASARSAGQVAPDISMLLLIAVSWNLAVIAHIFRESFEIRLLSAFMLTVRIFFASIHKPSKS